MSERTVVAQAIPASGSLWLGCRSWEHAPGSQQGEVELYLFRMWADLSSHGPCEDGSLVGWNARYWGLTSARAGRRDPDLQCGETVVFCSYGNVHQAPKHERSLFQHLQF